MPDPFRKSPKNNPISGYKWWIVIGVSIAISLFLSIAALITSVSLWKQIEYCQFHNHPPFKTLPLLEYPAFGGTNYPTSGGLSQNDYPAFDHHQSPRSQKSKQPTRQKKREEEENHVLD